MNLSPRVFALYNSAGGVGKSTIAKELGYSLAQKGQRVLLIDMDPQHSLTAFLGMKSAIPAPTTYDALLGEDDPIIPAVREDFDWGFDLVPASQFLGKAELDLVNADMKDVRLLNFISQHPDYEYVIIDCPPSMGILSYVALVATNYILAPIQTEFKSQEGTNLLLDMAHRVRNAQKAMKIEQIRFAGFIPTLYEGNNHHKAILDHIQELAVVAPILPTIENTISMANSTILQLPLSETLTRKEPIHRRVLDAIEQITEHVINL